MNFQMERLKQLPLLPQMQWQGSMFRMPAWVPNEQQKLYRPWSAIWVNVMTHKMSEPSMDSLEHKDLSVALDGLIQFACDKKLAGHRPGTIEVNDSQLADYLQEQLADTGITVIYREKLPGFDAMLAELAKHMSGGKLLPNALSVKHITLDRMRSFAEAAAEFYDAEPWRNLCDMDMVQIESPFVDPLLRYATILGNGGITYGIAFYDSIKFFEQFAAGGGMDAIKKSSYWTLFFGGIDELPFGDADLWEDNLLPAASDQAYPLAMCFEPKGKFRRPGPDILSFMEGLLRAFAQTTEDEIDSGRWQKTVRTFDGDMTFTLALPELLKSTEETKKQNAKSGRIPDRRAMEKINLDIQRILDGHDFKNTQEMQSFLNANVVGKPVPPQHPVTALEQAQDICYEAFEARGRKQIQLAKKALEVCPDCVDAYVILAESRSNPQEAYDLYAKGVEVGAKTLGKQFFKEEAGRFWGIIQTRPYMRARQGLAENLEKMGRVEEAIEHYQDMLRLNPNDNQGVRECLLPCLLITKRTQEADALLKRYKEDGMAMWNYGKALSTFIQKGDTPTARKCLKKAIECNAAAADYILEDGTLPPWPQSYSIGSEEEAIVCAHVQRLAWEFTTGAIDWLEENLD